MVGRQSVAVDLTAPLLDLPQPVGFVLVGIISGRWRYQQRTFLPKIIETTAQLATFERVLVEGEIWNSRNIIFELRPQPEGGSEMAPGAGLWRAAHEPDRVADHQPGFTDLLVGIPLLGCGDRCRDEGKHVRRCQRVEVFVADDDQAVAGHGVEGFAGVKQLARGFPRVRAPGCAGSPSAWR